MSTHAKRRRACRVLVAGIAGAAAAGLGVLLSIPGTVAAGNITVGISNAGLLSLTTGHCANGTTAQFCLDPATATMAAGDTVIWRNASSAEHNLSGRGTFTGETLAVHIPIGGSGSATLATADTIEYVCTIHPSLRGSISIASTTPTPQAVAATTPAPTGTAATARATSASPAPAPPSPTGVQATPSPAELPLTAGPLFPAIPTPQLTPPPKPTPIGASTVSPARPPILYLGGAVLFALILAVAGGYYGLRMWR